MSTPWLERVAHIEKSAYPHPWLAGNFADSLTAGYACQMLLADAANGSDAELIGYFVRLLLDALCLWSRGQGAEWLWLEVRISNTRARQIYEHCGFQHVGTRRNYYPLSAFAREDAIVMSLAL
jgi:ribosomal-protein-alanine N-acetyltransferase